MQLAKEHALEGRLPAHPNGWSVLPCGRFLPTSPPEYAAGHGTQLGEQRLRSMFGREKSGFEGVGDEGAEVFGGPAQLGDQ